VPKNSKGAVILPNDSLTTLGGNGSVFNVPMKVGDKKGAYKLKLKLEHGGAASTVIFVE